MQAFDLIAALVAVLIIIGLQLSFKYFTKHDNLSIKQSNLQLPRRLQHVSSTILISVLAFDVFDCWIVCPVLWLACGFILVIQYVRTINQSFNQSYMTAFQSLLRPHELDTVPSAFFIVSAAAILSSCQLIGLIDHRMIGLSMLCEAVGDPVAGIVGTWFKQSTEPLPHTKQSTSKPNTQLAYLSFNPKWNNGKSMIGSVAMFTTCLMTSSIYLSFYQIKLSLIVSCSFVGSLIATVTEALSGYQANASHKHLARFLDDNFLVPVAVAATMTILQYLAILGSF